MKTIVEIEHGKTAMNIPELVGERIDGYLSGLVRVTELPPPQGEQPVTQQKENLCDGCIHINEEETGCYKASGKYCANWQPAAPGAPAVERQINAPDIPIKRPTINGCLIIGCKEYDKDGNICLHIGACPHAMFDAKPCPSCEKLRAENAELNTQRNNAEIQLVAIIQAVSGFTKTKPKMTIGEFEKYLPKICKFAREAEKEEFERKIRLNQPKGE